MLTQAPCGLSVKGDEDVRTRSVCVIMRSNMDFRSSLSGYRCIVTSSHGRSDMSRRVVVVLCLLTVMNLGGFILNVSSPSRAAIAGMSYQDADARPKSLRGRFSWLLRTARSILNSLN